MPCIDLLLCSVLLPTGYQQLCVKTANKWHLTCTSKYLLHTIIYSNHCHNRHNLLLLSEPNKTPAIHFQQLVTSFQSTVLNHSTSHIRHSRHNLKLRTQSTGRHQKTRVSLWCYRLHYLSPETEQKTPTSYPDRHMHGFMSIYYKTVLNVTAVINFLPKITKYFIHIFPVTAYCIQIMLSTSDGEIHTQHTVCQIRFLHLNLQYSIL